MSTKSKSKQPTKYGVFYFSGRDQRWVGPYSNQTFTEKQIKQPAFDKHLTKVRGMLRNRLSVMKVR